MGSKIEAMTSWAELPVDLWEAIMEGLSCGDQVRLSAVCKNMLALVTYIKSLSNLVPWIVTIKKHSKYILECQLFEPTFSHLKPNVAFDSISIHRPAVHSIQDLNHIIKLRSSSHNMKLTVVDKIDLLQQFGIVPHCLLCVHLTCMHAWLFLSILNSDRTQTYFILFSPLTKKVITLPSLVHSSPASCLLYLSDQPLKTFSAEPDSSECVFLILEQNNGEQTITVRRIDHQDKEWTSRKYNRPYDSSLYDMPSDLISSRNYFSHVHIHGIFYFVFGNKGKVASYNIDQGEWKVETVFSDALFPDYQSCEIYNAFELKGELMLLCTFKKSPGFVARFDRSSECWVPVKSIGDHALFCCNSTFFARNSTLVAPVKKETRNNGVLPNQIYYFDRGCSLYSLENVNEVKYSDHAWDITGKFWFEPPYLMKLMNPPRAPSTKLLSGFTYLPVLSPDKAKEATISEEDELRSLRVPDKMKRSKNDGWANNKTSTRQSEIIWEASKEQRDLPTEKNE